MFHAAAADRTEIDTLAAWEAPPPDAFIASTTVPLQIVEKTLAAKMTPTSSDCDTAPTVSAMVQSLARAMPASSRLVPPSPQASRPSQIPLPPAQQPMRPPTQTARGSLPPLPPPLRPTTLPTQTLQAAVPPLSQKQESTPAPAVTVRSAPSPLSPHQQVFPLAIQLSWLPQLSLTPTAAKAFSHSGCKGASPLHSTPTAD